MQQTKLIKGSDVLGLKVISVLEGKELHPVNDIIYDPALNKVTALLIDKGGWFSDARVIAIEDVQSIGEDAVIIESSDRVRPASSVNQRTANIARDDINLTKTRIITDKGTDVGTITDIFFDSNGNVTEFEVSQGMFSTVQSGKKRIHVSDIITIGVDATVVKEDAKTTMASQANEQGIQGMFNAAKMKTAETIDTAKQKTTALREKGEEHALKAQYQAQELQQKAQDTYTQTKTDQRTQDIVQQVKEQNEKVMQTIEEKTDSVKEGLRSFWEQTMGPMQQNEDAKRTVDNVTVIAKQKTAQTKETLDEKVREATQIARKKTEQVRADMEPQQEVPPYTAPETPKASPPYIPPTTYAGMKGGKSRRKTRTSA